MDCEGADCDSNGGWGGASYDAPHSSNNNSTSENSREMN
jgi:hypothetical protein